MRVVTRCIVRNSTDRAYKFVTITYCLCSSSWRYSWTYLQIQSINNTITVSYILENILMRTLSCIGCIMPLVVITITDRSSFYWFILSCWQHSQVQSRLIVTTISILQSHSLCGAGGICLVVPYIRLTRADSYIIYYIICLWMNSQVQYFLQVATISSTTLNRIVVGTTCIVGCTTPIIRFTCHIAILVSLGWIDSQVQSHNTIATSSNSLEGLRIVT